MAIGPYDFEEEKEPLLGGHIATRKKPLPKHLGWFERHLIRERDERAGYCTHFECNEDSKERKRRLDEREAQKVAEWEKKRKELRNFFYGFLGVVAVVLILLIAPIVIQPAFWEVVAGIPSFILALYKFFGIFGILNISMFFYFVVQDEIHPAAGIFMMNVVTLICMALAGEYGFFNETLFGFLAVLH